MHRSRTYTIVHYMYVQCKQAKLCHAGLLQLYNDLVVRNHQRENNDQNRYFEVMHPRIHVVCNECMHSPVPALVLTGLTVRSSLYLGNGLKLGYCI